MHEKKTIAIIGAGYSGTAILASLERLQTSPLNVILFEKTSQFGLGHAYRTPYPYHLLNVRSKDMSAFEDDPQHFVHWLQSKNILSQEEQFVSRALYGEYLQSILQTAKTSQQVKVTLEPSEVIDAVIEGEQVKLTLQDGREMHADKVVLALGNNPPSAFPFPVASQLKTIENPWDYAAIEAIASHEPVLIVGTGLSMIDAVMSLQKRGHQGKIYALSRHGLLPLHHSDQHQSYVIPQKTQPLRSLTQMIRTHSKTHMQAGGDWRDVVNELRFHISRLWREASVAEKKQFMRHVMPYWNIHRHRVPTSVATLLSELQQQKQLEILAGRVISVTETEATIKLRHTHQTLTLPIQWLINCMGPTLTLQPEQQTLVQALVKKGMVTLDPLRLGFATDKVGAITDAAGNASSYFYTIGPPRKGESWECTAVPDIRKQNLELVKFLVKECCHGVNGARQRGTK